MEIDVSAKLVDIIYDTIECLTNEGINSLEAKTPLANAVIQSNALSFISNLTSISGMMDNFSPVVDDIHPDLAFETKANLLNNTLLSSLTDCFLNLPKKITTKDILNTVNNVTKMSFQYYPLHPSKDEIRMFLISIAEFYLVDKEIAFNLLFKDSNTINEIKSYSWMFDKINPDIRQLILNQVVQNKIFLDVNLLYLIFINTPLYMNKALTSLNLKNLEGGMDIYSKDFENDLKRIKSIQASKNAKIKANKEAIKKEPLYQKLERLWDKDNWSSKGRGKYSQFAKYVLYNDEIEGLEYDAIRNYISKYDKTKI